MPHDELIMWRFYLSEPRGEQRQDYHAAQITQAIYSIMQSFGSKGKKIQLEDCLLKFTTPEQDKSKLVSNALLMAKAWTEKMKKKPNSKAKPNSKLTKKLNISNER